jgi:hypothetical protein
MKFRIKSCYPLFNKKTALGYGFNLKCSFFNDLMLSIKLSKVLQNYKGLLCIYYLKKIKKIFLSKMRFFIYFYVLNRVFFNFKTVVKSLLFIFFLIRKVYKVQF